MRCIPIILISLLLTDCSQRNSDNKLTNANELILGERIHGPANFRDTINGKILFTLDDNALVETGPTENKWFTAGVFVQMTPEQIKSSVIYPSADLISNGKKIGKAIDTISFWMSSDSFGLIAGYTHQNNIKSNSSPEKVITELVNQKKLNFRDLEPFIRNFKFEKTDNGGLSDFAQYFIYESAIVDPSPRDRMTLLINKDSRLVGIIHSRALGATDFKTYDLVRGHRLTVKTDLGADEIKNLIERRINFYNSVD